VSNKPSSVIEKSEARLAAVKALYANQVNETKKTAGNVTLDILTYYHNQEEGVGSVKLDEKFLAKLIDGISEHGEALDKLIEKHLDESWKLDRLDQVIHTILQGGTYELLTFDKTPFKVIINEYVDIAKQFFDGKEVGFINAALDKIANEVRENE
jgi:N utilization substance protein B